MRYIDSWLTGLGLDYIIPKLKANGITTPKKLAMLTLRDMFEIGVEDAEDRKKLYFLIQRLQAILNNKGENVQQSIPEEEKSNPEGFLDDREEEIVAENEYINPPNVTEKNQDEDLRTLRRRAKGQGQESTTLDHNNPATSSSTSKKIPQELVQSSNLGNKSNQSKIPYSNNIKSIQQENEDDEYEDEDNSNKYNVGRNDNRNSAPSTSYQQKNTSNNKYSNRNIPVESYGGNSDSDQDNPLESSSSSSNISYQPNTNISGTNRNSTSVGHASSRSTSNQGRGREQRVVPARGDSPSPPDVPPPPRQLEQRNYTNKERERDGYQSNVLSNQAQHGGRDHHQQQQQQQQQRHYRDDSPSMLQPVVQPQQPHALIVDRSLHPVEDMAIRVVVKKRPISRSEEGRGDRDVMDIGAGGVVVVHEPKTKVDLTKVIESQAFVFDDSFDSFETNEVIYGRTIGHLVPFVFEGGKASCFAYGQTGSGKTFTMMGSRPEAPMEPLVNAGLYVIAVRDIFAQLRNNKYRNLQVMLSCFEIYGGKLFDLLNERNPVKCLEDAKQQVQTPGLTEHHASSVEELLNMMAKAHSIRSTGSTGANATSSRSHQVMQIVLKEAISANPAAGNGPAGYQPVRRRSLAAASAPPVAVQRGKLSFIDLAGSERGADNGSSSKQTRLEGAEINTSLLALKEVIRSLARDKTGHTPFRGSKLTQVLKDSFVGERTRTCMIACVSPSHSNCEHTLNTLRYADRVKEHQSSAVGGGPLQPVVGSAAPVMAASALSVTPPAILEQQLRPTSSNNYNNRPSSNGHRPSSRSGSGHRGSDSDDREREREDPLEDSVDSRPVSTPQLEGIAANPRRGSTKPVSKEEPRQSVVPRPAGGNRRHSSASPSGLVEPSKQQSQPQQQQQQQQQEVTKTRQPPAVPPQPVRRRQPSPDPLSDPPSDEEKDTPPRRRDPPPIPPESPISSRSQHDSSKKELILRTVDLLSAHKQSIAAMVEVMKDEMELVQNMESTEDRDSEIYMCSLENILTAKNDAISVLRAKLKRFKQYRQVQAQLQGNVVPSNTVTNANHGSMNSRK